MPLLVNVGDVLKVDTREKRSHLPRVVRSLSPAVWLLWVSRSSSPRSRLGEGSPVALAAAGTSPRRPQIHVGQTSEGEYIAGEDDDESEPVCGPSAAAPGLFGVAWLFVGVVWLFGDDAAVATTI